MVQDALLPDGQAPVEAGVRLERLETCLPNASYDGLRLPEPPAVRAETSGQYGMFLLRKAFALARV